MSLVLDAGALVAIERGDRSLVAAIKADLRRGVLPRTHGGVVGQVWRGGAGRQANLARLLPSVEVLPLDDALGRTAGLLLGRARARDVVDAAVAAIARDGDSILTSDPADLLTLVRAADLHVDLVPV